MEPRVSLITLGVDDLQRSLGFYRDGPGFPTTWDGSKGVGLLRLGARAWRESVCGAGEGRFRGVCGAANEVRGHCPCGTTCGGRKRWTRC